MRNCWVRSQGQDRQKYRELAVPLLSDGLGLGEAQSSANHSCFLTGRVPSEGLARGPDPCQVLLSKGSKEEEEQVARAG